MLKYSDKKQLYQLLTKEFALEEPLPLAKVALYLSQQGINCKAFGYKKIKLLFCDLPEFMTVRDIMCGENPQQEIILHQWKEHKQYTCENRLQDMEQGDFYRFVEISAACEKEFSNIFGLPKEKVKGYFSKEYEIAKQNGTLQVKNGEMWFDTDLARITLNGSREQGGKPWHLSFEVKKTNGKKHFLNNGQERSEFASLVNAPAKTLAAYSALTGISPQRVFQCLSEAYDCAKSQGRLSVTPEQISFETEQAIIYLKKSWYPHSGNPWHFSFSVKGSEAQEENCSAKELKTCYGGGEKDFSPALGEDDKRQIYQDLIQILPRDEKLHMAEVSKAMNDTGHTRERYGMSKMKQLLQRLPEFMTLEDVVLGGVQQTLVTLHDVEAWDLPTEFPFDQRTSSPKTASAAGDISKLPPVLDGYVQLVPKTLYKLTLAITGTEREPSQDIMERLRRSYEKARKSGAFFFQNDGYTFEVDAPSAYGGIVIVSIKRTDFGEYPWYLNFAGTKYHSGKNSSAPGKMLEQFAFLGSWNSFLAELAQKALEEPWDFESSSGKRYYILQKYIQYTFYRLQLEDKVCISDDERFAAFNTGLVTPRYDDIYACFESSDDAGHSTKWRFLEFCTAAGRGVGKRLVDCFNPLPQPASYFEKKEDLLFDLEKELHTDYEHILLDNISRFPLNFLKEECYGIREALECLGRIEQASDRILKKKRYKEFSELIAHTPRLFNRLRNRLEDAVDLARKQVRWNFKMAIPCFFPTRNVMSLMLPLSLQGDGQADIALVVELTRSGNYQGQTILTLQQAYLDGRLLCRPNSEWLDTKNIGTEEDEDDDDDE